LAAARLTVAFAASGGAVERFRDDGSYEVQMNASDVRKLVVNQIADRWDETNSHCVNLRSAIVTPSRTKMIHRLVRNGRFKDTIVEVWIVLRELTEGDGYVIFYDDARDQFGLASVGFPDDHHPIICGYYGDFWTTFKGM